MKPCTGYVSLIRSSAELREALNPNQTDLNFSPTVDRFYPEERAESACHGTKKPLALSGKQLCRLPDPRLNSPLEALALRNCRIHERWRHDDISLGQLVCPPRETASGAPVRLRFQNKVVLITGATSGIERAAALQFAAGGGKVDFCERFESLDRQVEDEIQPKGGEATYIRADVRNEADVQDFVHRIAQKYGRLEVASA